MSLSCDCCGYDIQVKFHWYFCPMCGQRLNLVEPECFGDGEKWDGIQCPVMCDWSSLCKARIGGKKWDGAA